MKHNHSCQCEHNNVAYCKCCRTVYCKDCNQEWTAKYNWSYQPWGGGYLGTVITGGSLGMQNSNTLHDGHTSVCSHGV